MRFENNDSGTKQRRQSWEANVIFGDFHRFVQALKWRLPVRYIMAWKQKYSWSNCFHIFCHLMVSLWHNRGWGLLLGEEGEVEDVGDGHLPGLGVDHLCRHSRLNVVILQGSVTQMQNSIWQLLALSMEKHLLAHSRSVSWSKALLQSQQEHGTRCRPCEHTMADIYLQILHSVSW